MCLQPGKREKKKKKRKLNLTLRKVHDSMVHDCSSTWNNDGIKVIFYGA